MSYSPTVVKSIQSGTIAMANTDTSKTATITSVNTAKSMITLTGLSSTQGNTTYPHARMARVTLTNATTVTADRGSGVDDLTVGYQVVEFY